MSSYDDSTIANGGLTTTAAAASRTSRRRTSPAATRSRTLDRRQRQHRHGDVTITVTAVPDPPATADDSYVTPQGTPLVQTAPGVLANDTDSGGGALVVNTTPVVAPANGALSLAADGSFTYTPAPRVHRQRHVHLPGHEPGDGPLCDTAS